MRACWTARRFVQPSRDAMDTMPGRLLCIDLQVDPVFGIDWPDPANAFVSPKDAAWPDFHG